MPAHNLARKRQEKKNVHTHAHGVGFVVCAWVSKSTYLSPSTELNCFNTFQYSSTGPSGTPHFPENRHDPGPATAVLAVGPPPTASTAVLGPLGGPKTGFRGGRTPPKMASQGIMPILWDFFQFGGHFLTLFCMKKHSAKMA